jgi:hypothetical protein
MPRPVLLFLYSTPNIAGSLLGLLGLLLFFTGIVKSFWVLIVIGLYGIGYLGAPRNGQVDLAIEHEIANEDLQQQLDKLLKQVDKHLSEPVMDRLKSIRETLIALIPHLQGMVRSDHNLHVIKSTASQYLPEMLEKYLALPPAFARFHSLKSGKTPRDLLLEQLDVLDRELKLILEDVHLKDTDALAAHGLFIKNKFASGREWLE